MSQGHNHNSVWSISDQIGHRHLRLLRAGKRKSLARLFCVGFVPVRAGGRSERLPVGLGCQTRQQVAFAIAAVCAAKAWNRDFEKAWS
jgi:hypothetical protein